MGRMSSRIKGYEKSRLGFISAQNALDYKSIFRLSFDMEWMNNIQRKVDSQRAGVAQVNSILLQLLLILFVIIIIINLLGAYSWAAADLSAPVYTFRVDLQKYQQLIVICKIVNLLQIPALRINPRSVDRYSWGSIVPVLPRVSFSVGGVVWSDSKPGREKMCHVVRPLRTTAADDK